MAAFPEKCCLRLRAPTRSLSCNQPCCGVRGIGQVAKLLAARAEVRLTRAFGSGTVRQGRGIQVRSVEETVREHQRRRMKHENGEGEMERYDMRTANTLSHACTRSLYATQGKCVRKMCVRHGVCTLAVATMWVRIPETKKKSSDFVVPLTF